MKINTRILLFAVCFAITINSVAQSKTENIVIVTLDGMRWQEVFGGADSALLKNKKYTKDSSGTSTDFWVDEITARRKKLFPFSGILLLPKASCMATAGPVIKLIMPTGTGFLTPVTMKFLPATPIQQ